MSIIERFQKFWPGRGVGGGCSGGGIAGGGTRQRLCAASRRPRRRAGFHGNPGWHGNSGWHGGHNWHGGGHWRGGYYGGGWGGGGVALGVLGGAVAGAAIASAANPYNYLLSVLRLFVPLQLCLSLLLRVRVLTGADLASVPVRPLLCVPPCRRQLRPSGRARRRALPDSGRISRCGPSPTRRTARRP